MFLLLLLIVVTASASFTYAAEYLVYKSISPTQGDFGSLDNAVELCGFRAECLADSVVHPLIGYRDVPLSAESMKLKSLAIYDDTGLFLSNDVLEIFGSDVCQNAVKKYGNVTNTLGGGWWTSFDGKKNCNDWTTQEHKTKGEYGTLDGNPRHCFKDNTSGCDEFRYLLCMCETE